MTAEELAEVAGTPALAKAAGKHGEGMAFGAAAYLKATADTVVNNGAASFSCVYWVKFTALPGATVRHDNVGWWDSVTANNRRWLTEYSGISNQFQIRLNNEALTQFVTGDATPRFTDIWYMVAYVIDVPNLMIHLSVDGAPFASLAWTGTVNITNTAARRFTNAKAGNKTGAASDDFTGVIDSLGVWSRTLSIDEVRQLYNLGQGLDFQGVLDADNAQESRHTTFHGLFVQTV